MVARRPLVVQSGLIAEVFPGDVALGGTTATQIIAGSGLTGGGALSASPRLDIQLAPNPSGIIFADTSLSLDGIAQRTADTAAISGNIALASAVTALSSGNAALSTASTALASGNAALSLVNSKSNDLSQSQSTFTAASAVVSGYAVGLDDTGRVQSVRVSVTDNSNPPIFPFTVVNVAGANYPTLGYDPDTNMYGFYYSYGPGGGYGQVTGGYLDGSTFTVGGGNFVLNNFQSLAAASITYDSLNKRSVICYGNVTLNQSFAVVYKLSRNGSSYGSSTAFTTNGYVTDVSACFDSVNNKVVIAYSDPGVGNNYGKAIVGTVSNYSITFGTPVIFQSSYIYSLSSCFDSVSGKVVISGSDLSNFSRVIVGNVSGTSISFGSPVTVSTNTGSAISLTYDSFNNKVVASLYDNTVSLGRSLVGTVSGTSISFGTPVTFETDIASFIGSTYDSNSKKIFLAYRRINGGAGIDEGRGIVGTVSGTTISFGSSGLFSSNPSNYSIPVFSPQNNRIVFTYVDAGPNLYITTVSPLFNYTYSPLLNSSTNVLGISQSTVSSGSSCLVNLPGGFYTAPSGTYVTGSFYYANPTTSGLTTASTAPPLWTGQTAWNYIGRAVSTSGLCILKSI